MQLQNLIHNLPPKVKDVIAFINKEGYKVGLIGGVTRDFLLENKISNDIDCELRRSRGLDDELKWDQLFTALSARFQVKLLNYQVIQIQLDQYEIDLNRPRVEVFHQENHHKNFDAKFIADADYYEGFLRRDFTVNAIMVEIYNDEIKIIDPLNGILHLKERKLEICGPDFERDPVRFLRALRFKHLLKFTFSDALNSVFLKINKIHTSAYYFKLEFLKSGNPIEILWDYCKIDSCFGELLAHKKEIEKFYNAMAAPDIYSLCQAVACSEASMKVKEDLRLLFGLSQNKVLMISNQKFSQDILTTSYTDKNFQNFIDWFAKFIDKLPVGVDTVLLERAQVKLSASEIQNALNFSVENNLEDIDSKLRKYYIWHLKLQNRN